MVLSNALFTFRAHFGDQVIVPGNITLGIDWLWTHSIGLQLSKRIADLASVPIFTVSNWIYLYDSD